MGKRPRLRAGPVVVRLDVADGDLRARLLALLGADERYSVRWHEAAGLDDAAVVIADRAVSAHVPVVLLTNDAAEAMDAVAAVLPADAAGELLEAAIRLVLAGLWVGPPVGRSGPSRSRSRSAGPTDDPAPPLELAPDEAPLTTREHEVLVLMAEGASNKMIAQRLGISVHTAKFHVGSVLGKLGARSRSDAIAIGLRRGLLLL
jgi:DNA-binding NarL/FixJ family response regulator